MRDRTVLTSRTNKLKAVSEQPSKYPGHGHDGEHSNGNQGFRRLRVVANKQTKSNNFRRKQNGVRESTA